MQFNLIIVSLTGYIVRLSESCKIQGEKHSGVCLYDYIDGSNRNWDCQDNDRCMPFCGRYIANFYPPCVPSRQFLERDRNFPEGRFTNHTTLDKDRWIEQKVKEIFELSERRKGYFFKDEDCRLAFERYMCWLNFPRCDENGDSLAMCDTTCKNYFKVCGYDHSHQQCSTDRRASSTFFFPGEPFVKNNNNEVMCTPGVKGESALLLSRSYNIVLIPIIAVLYYVN